MTIVKPYAINGRPIDAGSGNFSVCPVCPCPPLWATTCDDLLVYLHTLEIDFSGTYYNTGYILRSIADPLNPSYQHFLGALTFEYDGIPYIAFVTCSCSFVVWQWNTTYSIHEQGDACTCLADMLLEMYATHFGVTIHAEGALISPSTEEQPLSFTTHGRAVTFSCGENRYVALRDCDPNYCDSIDIRLLAQDQYYREIQGACSCPDVVYFILEAEKSGYEVFGNSILLTQPGAGIPDTRAMACYDDGNSWIYMGCNCLLNSQPNTAARYDLGCDDCYDFSHWEELRPGFIAKQRGSHSLYTGTFDFAKSTRMVKLNGYPHTEYETSGGGSIDYRTYVYLFERVDGSRVIITYEWDEQYSYWDSDFINVPNDTELAGHAELFEYSPDNTTIFGAAFTVTLQNRDWWDIFDTEQEAIEHANYVVPLPYGGVAGCNQEGHTSERHVGIPYIEKANCTYVVFVAGEYRYNQETGKWEARWGFYKGPIYHLRRIPTNLGFLSPDGTYTKELTLPTYASLETACAPSVYPSNAFEGWREGLVVVTPDSGEEDHMPCEEIDPEEFE